MTKIFVNGTFDIIHPGHLELLNYAKSLGTFLLVATDSDQRVKSLKGLNRPVNNEFTRKLVLENLKMVDKVVLFDYDVELEKIIKTFNPDIMIVGSDYENKKVIGSEHAKELRFYPRTAPYSTTKILENFVIRRFL